MYLQLPRLAQERILSTVTSIVDALADGLHKIDFDLDLLEKAGLPGIVSDLHNNLDEFITGKEREQEISLAEERAHRASVRLIYNENKL